MGTTGGIQLVRIAVITILENIQEGGHVGSRNRKRGWVLYSLVEASDEIEFTV